MKKIWILNHYATGMFSNQGGRHYWFAENLIKKGYEPRIFCANIRHNVNETINVGKEKYVEKVTNGIPFIFVKTKPYNSNGYTRIKNMISFYNNLFPVLNGYAEKHGKPDVILASSVHPLTLVAGIKLAKKFNIPCICEVRDLWPESIVAYGALTRKNIITRLLYQGEKWIYKNADSIIMTWQGGKEYITDQNWQDKISLKKIHHISNGIVMETFDENSRKYIIDDPELDNKDNINIVYAGSIRKVNNIGVLLDVAKKVQNRSEMNIKFLIYGSGDEEEKLKQRCVNENSSNVLFKGRIEKKYIPSLLKKSDINILHNTSTILDKYGQSQNKFFEYLAAGKCIVQTYTTGYSLYDKYHCGISARVQDAEAIAKILIDICKNSEERTMMGENARKLAQEFDFNILTNKLIDIVENATTERSF